MNPEHNPQLMYYALGAYAMFEGIEEIDTVRMSIRVRTRAEEHDGLLSVNGVTVAKGQNIYFRTPNLEYLGQCVEVSILNGEEGLYDKAGRDEKTPL